MPHCSSAGSAFALSLACCCWAAAAAPAEETRPAPDRNVSLRGGLNNSRVQFETKKKGRVAFIGGSITEMNGYRPMVCEWLKKRFPATEFTFIDAGVSSTCSTTGAFRLESDVLAGGPVDLFFVEFAVNDDQDAHHSRTACLRGMEGILRHARRSNPLMDVVVTYFVNESMLAELQAGRTPLTVDAHDAVARHYSVPSINLARQVADQIQDGTLTWKQYGGVHPAPHGNAIAARMIEQLAEQSWASPPTEPRLAPHPLPRPLDPLNYEFGRFVDLSRAKSQDGWTLGVPDWNALPGSKRERFTSAPLLSAVKPGARLSLEFEGTAVGAYVLAGPDAGIVEASVDGGEFRPTDLYHAYSKGLHYPRTVLLASELPPGKHVLTLRIAPTTNSAGHAVRILHFVANGT